MITVRSVLLQIRKHTYLSMCAFLVGLAMFYFACAILITIIPHYQQRIADEFSTLLGEPVDFKKIRFHWKGFRVYAKVYNINIGNNKDKVYINNINTVEVLIHPIKSLFAFRADIDDVTITGGRIHLNLKKSEQVDPNFNLQNLQKHLASVVNNPILSWVNVNQINLNNTYIVLTEGKEQKEYILASLRLYNASQYNYLHGLVYQINHQSVKNKERELLEIAIKFNKQSDQQPSRFYIATNSTGLTTIVNDYIEPAINNSSSETKITSTVVDPKTWLKIWGGITNTNVAKDSACVDYGFALESEQAVSQSKGSGATTCYNNILFSDDIQFVLNSPELVVNFSNNEQFALKNTHASFSMNLQEYNLKIHHLSAMFAGSNFNITGNINRADQIHNDGAPEVNLYMQFGHTDFRQFIEHLPLSLAIPDTHKWLKQHITKGWLGKAEILWRGKIDGNFPYDIKHDKPTGIFNLRAHLVHTDIDYAPETWPKIEKLDGILNIRARELTIDALDAEISKSKVERLNASISELGTDHRAQLILNGRLLTHGDDLHHVIGTTPLNMSLGGLNKATKFNGKMALDLNLNIPLAANDPTTVNGQLFLNDNDVIVHDTPFDFYHVNGTIGFTEHTVKSVGLKAEFDQRQALISVVNNNDDKGTFVRLNSWINMDYLARHYNLDLQEELNGTTDFQLDLNIKKESNKDKISVSVDSNLIGIESNVIVPYNKTKQQALPFKLKIEKENEQETGYNFIVKDNNDTKNFSYFDWVKKNGKSDLTITSQLLNGKLFFDDQTNKITARLENLKIQKTTKTQNTFSDNHFKWPAIEGSIKNLFYDNHLIGEVKFNTFPNKESKTVYIKNLSLTGDLLDLNLNGSYEKNSNISKTAGNYKINNLGKISELFGEKNFSEKLKLKGSYKLEWASDIFDPKLKNLNGEIDIDSGYGRITDIEPGLGRIFGFFNLASLEKRLKLDFSDVFEEGYKFDAISGKFKINNDLLSTKKTMISSGTLDIELYGSVDLNNKLYNLSADVTPHISSLPVAAAIIATPVAGAAIFIIDKLLDSPVDQLTERTYSITGPWSKPVVKKRKLKRGPLIEVSWFNPVVD